MRSAALVAMTIIAVLTIEIWGFSAWSWIAAAACPINEALLPLRTAEVPNVPQPACFEFWFNRYQALISGVLALIAATGAAMLVSLQINKMSEQNELARKARSIATYALLRERHVELRGFNPLIADTGKLVEIISEITIFETFDKIPKVDSRRDDARRQCEAIVAITQPLFDKYVGGSRVFDEVRALHIAIREIHIRLRMVQWEATRYAKDNTRSNIIVAFYVSQLRNLGVSLNDKEEAFKSAVKQERSRLQEVLRRLDRDFDA